MTKKEPRINEFAGFKDTLDGLARGSGVRWYGHVLRRDSGDVLRRALDFQVAERRGRGRSNMTWKSQEEEHTDQIGRKKEDANDREKWRDDEYELFEKHEVNPATCVKADKSGF